MTEDARRLRNIQKGAECHGWFADRLARVLGDLERQGFRPRVQCAARSWVAQATAKLTGKSNVSWSLHQAKGAAGIPEALAADVIDDEAPLKPSSRYVLALACAARRHGLETGIRWGHDELGKERIEAAIERFAMTGETGFALAPARKGWDPCHVQVPKAVLSYADAKAGKRP